VFSQGFLGYGLTSVMGPIVAEIFEGPHYGSIFGTITIALIGGGAAGPWMAGTIHDATGSYRPAFILIIVCCLVSAAAIWNAAHGRYALSPVGAKMTCNFVRFGAADSTRFASLVGRFR
jgi:MFS family permease